MTTTFRSIAAASVLGALLALVVVAIGGNLAALWAFLLLLAAIVAVLALRVLIMWVQARSTVRCLADVLKRTDNSVWVCRLLPSAAELPPIATWVEPLRGSGLGPIDVLVVVSSKTVELHIPASAAQPRLCLPLSDLMPEPDWVRDGFRTFEVVTAHLAGMGGSLRLRALNPPLLSGSNRLTRALGLALAEKSP